MKSDWNNRTGTLALRKGRGGKLGLWAVRCNILETVSRHLFLLFQGNRIIYIVMKCGKQTPQSVRL